jgi:broad specificity phosphatase PhoE
MERLGPPHRRHRPAADRGRPRRRRLAARAARRPRLRGRPEQPAAAGALAGLGDRAELDDDLREYDYGAYEGLTTDEIRERRPGWYLWQDGVPDGESPDDVGARADRVIARAAAVRGDVALFAHGHILRALGARWIDLPAAHAGRLALGTAAVCELGHEHDRRVIRLWNDTAHLAT